MKIRKGFVSNSSSSSFIICMKTEGKPTIEMVKKALKLNIDTILEDMAKILVDNAKFVKKSTFIKEEYCDEDHRWWGCVEKAKSIYDGSVCDEEGDYLEAMICNNMVIDYEDNDIIIKKECGY